MSIKLIFTIYRSGFIFISKNKDDLANLNFLSPFKYSVWVSMVLITILLMISMFIVIKYSYTSDNVLRLSDFFISIWGIWCQIGNLSYYNKIKIILQMLIQF